FLRDDSRSERAARAQVERATEEERRWSVLFVRSCQQRLKALRPPLPPKPSHAAVVSAPVAATPPARVPLTRRVQSRCVRGGPQRSAWQRGQGCASISDAYGLGYGPSIEKGGTNPSAVRSSVAVSARCLGPPPPMQQRPLSGIGVPGHGPLGKKAVEFHVRELPGRIA